MVLFLQAGLQTVLPGAPTRPALLGEEAQRNERAFGFQPEARDMKLATTKGRPSRTPVLKEIITIISEHSKTPKPSRFSGFSFCLKICLGANLVQVLKTPYDHQKT